MTIKMHAAYLGVVEENHPASWVAHMKKYNATIARKVVTTANLLRLADADCWHSRISDEDPDAREVVQFLEVKDDAGHLVAIIRRVNGSRGKHKWNNTDGWIYTVFVNFPSHNGEQFGGGNLELYRHESGNYTSVFGNYTFHGFHITH
jgi:hypothetical protein